MRFTLTCAHGDEVSVLRVDAPDAAAAGELAASRGLSVLSLRTGIRIRLPFQAAAPAFPTLLFAQELSALLKAGLSLMESLGALEEKESRLAVRRTLSELLIALREGRSLSQGLAQHANAFPKILVSLVQASERTGNLREALERYIAYRMQLDEVRNRVITALTYPAILLAVGACVIAFLMFYVVPRFSRIYVELKGTLPFLSRVLLETGQIVDRHWFAVAAASVISLAVFAYALSTASIREAGLARVLRIPALAARLKTYQLSRLYRTLGLLLKSGIPILISIEMAKGLLGEQLRSSVARAAQLMREGGSIAASFQREALSTSVSARLMTVGERTGDMGEMFEQAARFHDEELARHITRFVRIFEPSVMALMGLVIGLIVVLMYLPIFELAGSLQ